MAMLADNQANGHAKTVAVRPLLIGPGWRRSSSSESFEAVNPASGEIVGDRFPVSHWDDIDAALQYATTAAHAIRRLPDSSARIASFLERFAAGIDARATQLAATAEAETGLPARNRFAAIEIPRTVRQLRLAAAAAIDGSWMRPTIDQENDLRSCYAPVGPVFVIGPNNFPFAFNGICGGDFAAAVACGNPVIAKGHPLHPNTTSQVAEIAIEAMAFAHLPEGMVQLLYHMQPADGVRLIEDPRLKAVAFTGSRHAGLQLKAAADRTGKLFFGEMSSINPVIVLPGAIAESKDAIADQFVASMLAGTGQFCTKPGLLVVLESAEADTFISTICDRLVSAPAGLLFAESGRKSLGSSVDRYVKAGATRLTSITHQGTAGIRFPNTLLRVSGATFLSDPSTFGAEAFGNAALVVVARDGDELIRIIESLEGNLTGSIYSSSSSQTDEKTYNKVAPSLRTRVGRFLNDKMPTGVTVSPAMNHGGPYPATSQSHFTAVGLPNAMMRFTQLECYDKVRQHRLPACLRDERPQGTMWRQIDGAWTQTK